MVIVKLWGGMCNQMFQYAFGYALAKKNGDELFFEDEFFENQPSHTGKRKLISKDDFKLTKLNTVQRPFIASVLENKYISHIIRYYSGCSLRLPSLNIIIEKLHKYYDVIPYSPDKVNYYDGYWQSVKYFQEFADDIRREFTPSEKVIKAVREWKNSINSSCCVAVHIRRGDYLNKANQAGVENIVGGSSYYNRAIQYMQEQLNDPVFCFVSDDIGWCRKEFGGIKDSVFVVNQGSDAAIADLFTIAICEHGIMSPGTFSWWGNWLRKESNNSIVITPDLSTIIPYLALEEWVVI